MHIFEIPTPALLVDIRRLKANITHAQKRAEQEDVVLRPHIKTHKSPDIARVQQEAGARGITVATISEAEAFATAGFGDIVIAKEVVDTLSFRRILALLRSGVRMAMCVDTMAGVEAASSFFSESQSSVDVLIEVDTGHGRCGVEWDDPHAPEFAGHLCSMPGLNLRGLLTHAGHGYAGPDKGETQEEALGRVMAEERDRLLTLAEKLGARKLLDPSDAVLSVGSTPTFSQFENVARDGFRITEARPGNYVFHDAIQVALGVCALQDCALTMLSTVTSAKRGNGVERVYVDAGKKTLTTDRGYGLDDYGVILHSPRTMKQMPHARLVALSEEHGWIEIPGGAPFDIGDRIRIVPNHACVAVATQSRLYAVEGDQVVAQWHTVAR
ncbi:MAG: alanine racemase [Rubricoccaceae bacterium]|nr:alanine racemase [Rubricoccaceae bacterium]